MGAIGDVFFRALFEDSQFTAEAKRVGTKIGNTAGLTMGQRMGASLGKSLNQNLGRGVGNAANNIGKIIATGTAVAVGGLVGATKAAIDFEDAFAGIRKTVDEADLKAAGLTFEDLSDSIRKMAREIPIAATELAAIGEAAGALGIRGQDIEKFTEIVAKLSVTTDLTSEQAATALGQLGTTLNLTGDDFLEFGDVLVALGNAGASTESQIIDMAARFAAAGTSAGLSKEEVLALSSAVASMGIEVEAGGTALSQTFNNVTTGIATSSAEAKAFAETLGLSAAQFKTAWDRDALGTFEDFLQELNKMDQFERANILDKVGITGARQLNAVALMAQNVGFVNDQLEISRTATGALGEEAAKKFATTANQIQLLKNNLTDVGITIGNAVLPTITKMIGQFSTFLNDPKTQTGIKAFAVDLGKAVEGAAQWISRLDFDAIASSLKLAAGFAKGLLSAFMSAPQWLQAAVVTGWGLNKLTGGVVGTILGDVTKTLLAGLGQQFIARGSSPANPMFVSDVTGGIGGAAGKTGLLGTLLKGVFPATVILGIGTAIGSVIVDNLGGPLTDKEKQTGTGRDVEIAGLDVVMGQNYAAKVRAEDERRRRQQNQSGSPDDRQARDDLHKLAQTALEEHRRGERGTAETNATLASLDAEVAAMHHALHADLSNAVDVLRTSNDPAAIAAAVEAAVASVTGGAGSAGTTQGLIGDLTAQLRAAEAANNAPLAAQIKAAIAQLEPFAKGRQWQAEQLAKAQAVVDSNKTTAEKTAELKTIQQDLLSHQRTMAADIVGELIDVENAVKNIKVNASTGFVTNGPYSTPKDDKPKPKGPLVPGGAVKRQLRARGGPVTAGSPYWVGEEGRPELFVPSASGNIVPAADVPGMAGGNTTINVPIQGVIPYRDAMTIPDQLRRLRDFGVLTPRRSGT